jgi:acyl-CoA synthetase (AMP-forming)/AMP-acid ligase II
MAHRSGSKISTFIAGKISQAISAREIDIFAESLVKNASGKILKRESRESYEDTA